MDTETLDRRAPTVATSPSTGTSLTLWRAPSPAAGGNELRASAVSSPSWVGHPTCGTGITNSTGLAARMDALGSDFVTENSLTLLASRLPESSFGFFLGSQTQALVVGPGGSQRNIWPRRLDRTLR